MAMKPPIIGPRVGSIKGAVEKIAIPSPRWAGGKRSAIWPAELVSDDAPKVPARNLKINNDAIELQPAAAPTKATVKTESNEEQDLSSIQLS